MMENVSEFVCDSKKLQLNILDFCPKDPSHTKYKATLSSMEERENLQAMIVSMQVLKIPELKTGKNLRILRIKEICPGMEENKVLPLLSQFGNVNFTCVMFLIEKVVNYVVYRSRDCEMIISKKEKLCSSCKDLFKSLAVDYEGEEEPCAEVENNCEEVNIDENVPAKSVQLKDSFTKTEVGSKIQNYSRKSLENSNLEKYSCKECGESFSSKDMLGVHLSKTSCIPKLASPGESSLDHHCNLCTKRFRYENALALHCKKSHNLGYLKDCPFCEEHFDISESVEDFYNHLNTSHGSEIENDVFKEIIEEYTNCKRLCQKCGKTFNSYCSWIFHMKRWHMEPDPSTHKTCHICGKIVKANMIHHLKTHVQEESICPECGVSLKNKMYLNAHMRIHKKVPFPCETCGKKFQTKSYLKSHIDFVHLKKRPHKCEHCDKGFLTRHKVECHIRSIHTKEKPYFCEDCDYRCSRKDGINAHRRNVHDKVMI